MFNWLKKWQKKHPATAQKSAQSSRLTTNYSTPKPSLAPAENVIHVPHIRSNQTHRTCALLDGSPISASEFGLIRWPASPEDQAESYPRLPTRNWIDQPAPGVTQSGPSENFQNSTPQTTSYNTPSYPSHCAADYLPSSSTGAGDGTPSTGASCD